jgi:hypothetical protein
MGDIIKLTDGSGDVIRTSLRIPTNLFLDLERRAQRDGKPVSIVIEDALARRYSDGAVNYFEPLAHNIGDQYARPVVLPRVYVVGLENDGRAMGASVDAIACGILYEVLK